MSGGHPEPTEPRIVRKKKVHGGGHHGGAWKVAYADFVTAMMALFIVLWIMSQSQSIRNNVAQYFKNPGLLAGATGLMETSDMGGEIPTPGHSQDLQTPSPIRPDLSSERGSLEEVKKRLAEVIAQLPELSRLKDQVALEITEDGLRIELMDRENSHFFDLGSTNLKRETQELLKLIAQELGRLPNHITVEGHTDSRPYGSKSYTNWELSADRANAARRLLEEAGVKGGQVIAVRGCADRQLRNQQEPLDFQNRRVSILVMFQGQSRQELQDLKKIQAEAGKNPKQSEAGGPPGAPAPAVSGDGGAPLPPAPSPEKTEVEPPGKTESPPVAPSVYQGQVTPPVPRLDGQVREEVRQLLQGEGLTNPAPGKAGSGAGQPRSRLGW